MKVYDQNTLLRIRNLQHILWTTASGIGDLVDANVAPADLDQLAESTRQLNTYFAILNRIHNDAPDVA